MLFNSFQFLIFFPLVTLIYFLLPHRYRWLHLLLASCVFYMAFIPVYILILFITILIDYFAGLMIEASQGKKRKIYLALSIVANVSVLAIFKYYNFFIDNWNAVASSFHLAASPSGYLNIILPIGLSFHTFQAMSYTIEVYRGNIKPERHFGYYSLYVMFYPQLVAGPIERPQNVLPQLHAYHPYNHQKLVSGLRLMLWGLFKKVVIADRLGMMVNEVYNNPDQYSGFSYVLATICFGIQIYCDFSGYSDIAIGSARTMGIDLMTNFRRPYFAASIAEFWRRWHISLSTWFRDYLYIPLGGNRVPAFRRNVNLMIIFMVSGLWHGASWNFVIWGALHGAYSVVANFVHQRVPFLRQINVVNIVLTFVLVNFAWIFFRAATFESAAQIATHLLTPAIDGHYFSMVNNGLQQDALYMGQPFWKFCLSLSLIPFLFVCDWLIERGYVQTFLHSRPVVVRWSVYYLLVIGILIFGVFDTDSFIYFQF
jgi:alginate O-acetyltransferase complex protein AlgI